MPEREQERSLARLFAKDKAARDADFDTLLDCPIYAGNPAVYEFAVDGNTILYSLSALKGMGHQAAREIVAARGFL